MKFNSKKAVSAALMFSFAVIATACASSEEEKTNETTKETTATVLSEETTSLPIGAAADTDTPEETDVIEEYDSDEIDIVNEGDTVKIIHIGGETSDEEVTNSILEQTADISSLVPDEDGSIIFMMEDSEGNTYEGGKIYTSTGSVGYDVKNSDIDFDEFLADFEESGALDIELDGSEPEVQVYTIDDEGNFIFSE